MQGEECVTAYLLQLLCLLLACSLHPAPSSQHPCTSGLHMHPAPSARGHPPCHPPGLTRCCSSVPLAQSPLKAKSLGSTNRCRLECCCCISRLREHWDLCTSGTPDLAPSQIRSDRLTRADLMRHSTAVPNSGRRPTPVLCGSCSASGPDTTSQTPSHTPPFLSSSHLSLLPPRAPSQT